MNTWPMKIVFISLCFTFSYASLERSSPKPTLGAITNVFNNASTFIANSIKKRAIKCDFGWVPADGKCYKIITVAAGKNNLKLCKTYAALAPRGLKNIWGFSEKVWIMKNDRPNAIDLKDEASVNERGRYYSLCEESHRENTYFWLYVSVRFHDGNWIIPNSQFIIDESETFLKEHQINSVVWVGLYYNGSFFWADGVQLTKKHESLLNISKNGLKKSQYLMRYVKTVFREIEYLLDVYVDNATFRPSPSDKHQCGVYSLQRKFSFRNCSEVLLGLGKMTPEIVSSTPGSSTPEQLTTMTEEEYISTSTYDELTSETENQSTSWSNTPNSTYYNNTVSYFTSDQSTNNTVSYFTTEQTTNNTEQTTTSKRCFCSCNRTKMTGEEFKESIKDLKIKETEVSKYKRSKISAPDERVSSRAIGAVAVLVMVVPFGLIIISDLPLIIRPLLMYLRKG